MPRNDYYSRLARLTEECILAKVLNQNPNILFGYQNQETPCYGKSGVFCFLAAEDILGL